MKLKTNQKQLRGLKPKSTWGFFQPVFLLEGKEWKRQWKTLLIPVNKSTHDFNSGDYICAYSLKYELLPRHSHWSPLFQQQWWASICSPAIDARDTWKQLLSAMGENVVYVKCINGNELSLFLKINGLLRVVPTNSLATLDISCYEGLRLPSWDNWVIVKRLQTCVFLWQGRYTLAHTSYLRNQTVCLLLCCCIDYRCSSDLSIPLICPTA